MERRAKSTTVTNHLEAKMESLSRGLQQADVKLQEKIRACIQAEDALRASERRYRSLFDEAPHAALEVDFSAVLEYVATLTAADVDGLPAYFEHHPEQLVRCASLLSFLNINKAALSFFAAAGKRDLKIKVQSLLTPESTAVFLDIILALMRGERTLFREMTICLPNGQTREFILRWQRVSPIASAPFRCLISMSDVTECNKIHRQLLRDRHQLRVLASKLSVAEEQERRQIAADLHDTVGQSLALAKMKLAALQRSAPSPAMKDAIHEVSALIDQAATETRSLIFEISPPILYDFGLEAALEWLMEDFKRRADLRIELHCETPLDPLPEDLRVLLFRSVRELLVNVVKHAQAQKIIISARREDSIVVEVKDDGTGFDVQKLQLYHHADSGGFGLLNIRERLQQVHGELRITSHPGCGACITLKVPV